MQTKQLFIVILLLIGSVVFDAIFALHIYNFLGDPLEFFSDHPLNLGAFIAFLVLFGVLSASLYGYAHEIYLKKFPKKNLFFFRLLFVFIFLGLGTLLLSSNFYTKYTTGNILAGIVLFIASFFGPTLFRFMRSHSKSFGEPNK